MANITKKGDGKYLIRVSKGTGKRRVWDNQMFHGTLKEARDEGRDMEILLSRGKLASLRFAKCVDVWIKAVTPKVAPRTIDGYEGSIRRYATPLIGEKKLGKITREDIQDVYDECRLSSTTVRNLHASLNAFFAWCVRRRDLKENPCKNTDRPKKKRAVITVLQGNEIERFVSGCRQHLHGPIFEFALETGMRPEEYLALRWSDVRDCDVSVERAVQYNRKGGGFYFAEPKTAKSRRLVPISEDLRRCLHRHRIDQLGHRLSMKGTWFDLELVFPNEVGNPLTLAKLSHYFKPGWTKPKKGTRPNRPERVPSVLELAGLEHKKELTLYSLRHTMATTLLVAGVNPKVVSDRLGHSSVVQTLDTYSHVLPHIQADATEMMNRAMRKAV